MWTLTSGEGVPSDVRRVLETLFETCREPLERREQLVLSLWTCGLQVEDIGEVLFMSQADTMTCLRQAQAALQHERVRPEASWSFRKHLTGVLEVIYLMHTIGHTAPTGDELIRQDLSAHALDLVQALGALLPDEQEVVGLTALIQVALARRAGRVDGAGRLVTLDKQDRTAWDIVEIRRSQEAVRKALAGGKPGRYLLEAAIACEHGAAPRAKDTDWHRILALYDQLVLVTPTPVVALNRAVALSMTAGPSAALRELDRLVRAGYPADNHRLPAVRAALLRKIGRNEDAAASYRRAIGLTLNGVEREYLIAQLVAVQAEVSAPDVQSP